MNSERLNYYTAASSMMKKMMELEETTKKSILPYSLCELVKIRVSQINGCAFCLDMHTKDALAAGEDTRRLFTLSAWRETSFFSEQEKAALLWAETLTLISKKQVSNEIYNKVAIHFNEQELAELTVIINVINCWNRFAIAFAKQPQ